MNRRRIPFLPILAILLLLCIGALGALLWMERSGGQAPVEGPLAGAPIGGPFSLVNQDGRPVTEADFAGRYRLMYFGYTFCPDVCPMDVQRMAQGLRRFETEHPARAARVQPIFITVDPERDTVPEVKSFVTAFHPRLVGLTGSKEQVAEAMAAYRIYAAKRGPADARDYLVDHSAMIYLMGPDGEPISFFAQDATPERIAEELATYVR